MSKFNEALEFLNNTTTNNYSDTKGILPFIKDLVTGNTETKSSLRQSIIDRLKDDNGKGILKNDSAKEIAGMNIDSIVYSLSKEMKANELDILSALDYNSSNNSLNYNKLDDKSTIDNIKKTYQTMMQVKASGVLSYRNKEAINAFNEITGDNLSNAKVLAKKLNDETYGFNNNDKLSILGVMKNNIKSLKDEGFDSNLAFNSTLNAAVKVQSDIANGTITDKNTAENETSKLIKNYADNYKDLLENKDRAANLHLLTAGKYYNSDVLSNKSDKELSQLARQTIGNNYYEKFNTIKKASNLFETLPDNLRDKEIYRSLFNENNINTSNINNSNSVLDAALKEQNLGRYPGYLSELNVETNNSGINNFLNSNNRASALGIGNNISKDVIVHINFNDEVVSTIGKWISRNKGE